MQLVCITLHSSMDLLLVLSSSSAVCSHSQAASTNHCVTAQRKAATTTGVDVGVSQEVSANVCSAVHLVSALSGLEVRGYEESSDFGGFKGMRTL